MSGVILRTAAGILQPLLLLFSVFLLVRGHNEPGGGFSAGLVAAAAFVLYGFAAGVPAARRLLRADPRTIAAAGLLVALASGLPSLLDGGGYLGGRWADADLPGLGTVALGTPLLFDLGVYLVVIGVALRIIFTLAEDPS